MKLGKYKEKANRMSAKAGEITRQLAFAGIALIWVFKTQSASGDISICSELYYPLQLFVIALIIDLSQYIYSTTVWSIFFRVHEYKAYITHMKKKDEKFETNKLKYFFFGKEEDCNFKLPDVKAHAIIPNLTYLFFYAKTFLMIYAYYFITIYLTQKIK